MIRRKFQSFFRKKKEEVIFLFFWVHYIRINQILCALHDVNFNLIKDSTRYTKFLIPIDVVCEFLVFNWSIEIS